ncbi:MAG: GNAT family N-acetyltransferase [Roseiflexaceae bacterium]
MSTLIHPPIQVVRGQIAAIAHATMTKTTPETLHCDYEYDIPQEVLHFDADLADAGIPFRRWLIGDAENPVAIAFCFRATWNTPRHTFWAHVRVAPAFRGQGIGLHLLKTVHHWAASAGAQRLRVMSHPDAHTIRFLERNAYQHIGTEQLFGLSIGTHILPYQQTYSDNLEITTLDELMRSHPDAVEHACVLHAAVSLDVPMPDEPIVTLSKFRRLLGESIDPADFLVAIRNGMMVGESILTRDDDNPQVYWQHATGVLPAFRGQHIATRLKLAAIERAHLRGAHQLRTWMELSNHPIIQLNHTLGFRTLEEPGSKIYIFETVL